MIDIIKIAINSGWQIFDMEINLGFMNFKLWYLPAMSLIVTIIAILVIPKKE